jgi:hypothetical protein
VAFIHQLDNNPNDNNMTTMPPKLFYRFVYFNVRGAGELCRLTLIASGAEWEDVRYPMALASTGFSYGPEFRRDAHTGAFNINMGSLPILQVVSMEEEKSPRLIANLGQSHSIAKFVASQHGMAGRDSLEQAKIDALYESCRDIKSQWYRTKRNKGGKKSWFSGQPSAAGEAKGDESDDDTGDDAPKTLAEYCMRLEKAIAASCSTHERTSGSPWCMGGSEPSLADVAVYHLLGTPPASVVTGGVPSFFDGESDRIQHAYPPQQCPRLFESISAFGELKSIKEWEKKRPETFT